MPLTKNQEKGCGRLEREEIINGEIFAKETEGMKSKAQREGLGLNKRRDPSVVVEEWRGRQWALMREGSKNGCGCEYIFKERQKVEGLSISWCLSL